MGLAGTMIVLAAGLPEDARAADVAVGGDGSAFLVSGGTPPGPGRPAPVRVRVARPDAAFGPARTLMRSTRADRAVDAGVASDGSGVIAVQRVAAGRRHVRVVRFHRRARVGRGVTVSRGDASDFAALDVAPSGAAVLVWFRHRRDGRWRLEAAVRRPAASAFGPAQPLSAFVRRPCCTRVSAAIGERGHAAVTWTSTSRPHVWAARAGPAGRFRPPQTLARDSADAPRAAVGASGAAIVIYSIQRVPRSAADGLKLHRAAPGSRFGAAEPVNPGGGVTVGDAAVTRAGRVTVAWIDTAIRRVRLSEAGPGQPPADAGALGANVSGERLAVATDDDGRAVVAWPEVASIGDVHRERIVAALRPAAGAPFGPAVAIGRPRRAAEPEAVTLLPQSGALVVWKRSRFDGRAGRRAAPAVARLP